MSNSLNRCEFIGRLGQSPETRYLPDGTAVTNLSIACDWKSKDKSGTEWIRIVAFGKLAEIMNEYLAKGSQVFISGRMRTRSWEKDGQKHYATEIVADQLQMLDKKGQESAGPTPNANMGGDDDRHKNDFDDDIPF